jgi:hypothetical protein
VFPPVDFFHGAVILTYSDVYALGGRSPLWTSNHWNRLTVFPKRGAYSLRADRWMDNLTAWGKIFDEITTNILLLRRDNKNQQVPME